MSDSKCCCWCVINGNDVDGDGVGDGAAIAINDGVVDVGEAVEVVVRSEGVTVGAVTGDGAVGGTETGDFEVVDIAGDDGGAIGSKDDVRVSDAVEEIASREGVGGVFCAVG